MEISRRMGIIFGRHSGIFPRSGEKVNNAVKILTCQWQQNTSELTSIFLYFPHRDTTLVYAVCNNWEIFRGLSKKNLMARVFRLLDFPVLRQIGSRILERTWKPDPARFHCVNYTCFRMQRCKESLTNGTRFRPVAIGIKRYWSTTWSSIYK